MLVCSLKLFLLLIDTARGLFLLAFYFCFQLVRFRELLIQIYLDFLADLGCWKLFVAFQLRMSMKVLFSAVRYHRPFGNAQRVCTNVEAVG